MTRLEFLQFRTLLLEESEIVSNFIKVIFFSHTQLWNAATTVDTGKFNVGMPLNEKVFLSVNEATEIIFSSEITLLYQGLSGRTCYCPSAALSPKPYH